MIGRWGRRTDTRNIDDVEQRSDLSADLLYAHGEAIGPPYCSLRNFQPWFENIMWCQIKNKKSFKLLQVFIVPLFPILQTSNIQFFFHMCYSAKKAKFPLPSFRYIHFLPKIWSKYMWWSCLFATKVIPAIWNYEWTPNQHQQAPFEFTVVPIMISHTGSSRSRYVLPQTISRSIRSPNRCIILLSKPKHQKKCKCDIRYMV